MTGLYERDGRVIAAAQRLRFFPLAPVAGCGARLREADGRELIDLSGAWGAAAVGYGHSAVAAAVAGAVRTMPGASLLSGTNPEAVALAEELVALLPQIPDARVYLGHSGSDANAAALRSIRAATDRTRILAFDGSYHGGLGPAQEVSGVWIDGGTAPAADLTMIPYLSLDAAEAELGKGDVAAVLVEPILSDGGLVIPPDGQLRRLADLTHEHGAWLLVDEVKVGLGRTGWLHAFEAEGVVPDVVTFGKALGGGLPLSAAVGRAEIMDAAEGSSLLTTAGNPVCAAAGRAVLHTLAAEGLVERSAVLGHVLSDHLAELSDRHESVSDTRSRGLCAGIELDSAITAAKVVHRAHELGAVVYYVGTGSNVLELTPPLVISAQDLARGIDILDAALADVADGLVHDEVVTAYRGW
ncbi:MAG TPA: aminotransferase class III-fold pyridoxal phosphate-dependent enzyme [Flexivirga sp.]|uniref:aspartate aminotransferase family protein n=1 Tax=Flexivirga sp. TaxID=1962927 RepID=UPI002D145509|nr:aminotransferase class III-fold pyridoxal phosphate-dependent enzyme [Flexivirga sp.]HWC22821.1 aminotransferase class III-fold pyridoxal phosphate-dependent enzyme [Flexivirga sp.]